jgi:hypothetical protein
MIHDLAIVQDANHHIKVVGEVKPPWTFQRLKSQSRNDFLVVKFGKNIRTHYHFRKLAFQISDTDLFGQIAAYVQNLR